MAGGAKSPPKPDPMPRPGTALARETKRAEFARRQSKHAKLAKRLLGERYKGTE
jgi:hypothetical protein